MVTEMTKYDFILMSGDADAFAFLEKLQSVGVVDITRSLKPIDEKSEKLSARAEVYRDALSALKEVEKAEDPGQKPTDFAVEVMETVRDKGAIEAQLPQLRKDADELVPWGQFDAKSFDRLKETGLKLHFYKAKAIDPAWKEQYALSEISNLGGNSYFVVVSDTDDYDFPLKELPSPDRDYAAIEKQIADLEAQVKEKEHRLAQLKWHEPVIQAELDKTMSKLDLHLAHASGEKAAEDYITVFEGFAPKENEPALHDMLEKENILYLVDKAKVDDNPPIKLKNNKFVSMFEMLTDMYGRPKYDEFDPTVFGLRPRAHLGEPRAEESVGQDCASRRDLGHCHHGSGTLVPHLLLCRYAHLEVHPRRGEAFHAAFTDCRLRRHDGFGLARRYRTHLSRHDCQDLPKYQGERLRQFLGYLGLDFAYRGRCHRGRSRLDGRDGQGFDEVDCHRVRQPIRLGHFLPQRPETQSFAQLRFGLVGNLQHGHGLARRRVELFALVRLGLGWCQTRRGLQRHWLASPW